MTLDYDPTRHEYRVDGKLVPSVTQLVAPLGQDYDEPDDMTESVLDAATERGTTMHEYLAWRLNGGTREEFELPDIYEPYADAVELFLYEHDICPFAIETPVCGAWRGVTYAGTPDLVGEFDGILSILDYKFVSQIAKSKVGAQLHGYRVLCEQNGVYPGDLYAVQFLNTGDYRLYCVGAGAADSLNACVEIYAQKTKKHPRGAIN